MTDHALWHHAAWPTTPGRPPRQTMPSGIMQRGPQHLGGHRDRPCHMASCSVADNTWEATMTDHALWHHAAWPTTPGRPPRQTMPSGIMHGGPQHLGGHPDRPCPLASCSVAHNTWEATATDHALWRHAAWPTTPGRPPRQTMPSGVVHAMLVTRLPIEEVRRPEGDDIETELSSNIDTFVCHVCGRLSGASRIKLHSHNQTYSTD